MASKILLGALAVALAALGCSAAVAADLSVPASSEAFDWTGFYVGAEGGYAWTRFGSFGFRDKPKGGLLGAYAGYNFQFPESNIVVGAETDFAFADIDHRYALFTLGGGINVKDSVKWEGATRARLGFAVGRVLFYGAAGVAYVKRELTIRPVFFGAPAATGNSRDIGWTVGGGVEAAVLDGLVARIEYRYTDYGSDSKVLIARPFAYATYRSLDEHRVMAGLSYKFN